MLINRGKKEDIISNDLSMQYYVEIFGIHLFDVFFCFESSKEKIKDKYLLGKRK